MKTTKRFDKAVIKLYNAFHKGRLNSNHCGACAVGNIVGHGFWSGGAPSDYIIGVRMVREITINDNVSGYNKKELAGIEYRFIMAVHSSGPTYNGKKGRYNEKKKDHFRGLCAVVEYLCELDNIPNVMDFTKLFEYNKENQPIYRL